MIAEQRVGVIQLTTDSHGWILAASRTRLGIALEAIARQFDSLTQIFADKAGLSCSSRGLK